MRPPGALPRLTRRSRRLVAAALVIVILLLLGPRLVDTYINWLWFGELGYRSVFTTVLLTRISLFVIVGTLVGGIVCAGFVFAYRARPVFVPSRGPGDALAQYRALILAKSRTFLVGIPVLVGILAGMVAQSYWMAVQLYLEGGSFGIKDPQFGLDLGFFAFDLPFYRFVLTYLFVAVFIALFANALVHYIFGGVRLSGREGALSRPARIQLVSLVGILVVLKVVAYWLDRYELLSNTRAGKPFTGAGYTDINAVLPAKSILLAIAVICAIAVFSALVLRDLRIPAIGLALLLLSSLVVGAGWPMIVEQFSVKPNAAQKESEYIARSIKATREAYGLTAQTVSYRDYSKRGPGAPVQARNDQATISNIRLLDPNIVGPAFLQLQQGKNFYNFPSQLAIDRYRSPDGQLRDYVVAARELDQRQLEDNQLDWIPRHTVYTHGNGFIAAPANTVRGVANDPNANGGYPDFMVNTVDSDPAVGGPVPLDQPRVYFGPIIGSSPDDYAIVGRNGDDREYDTDTKNYTYTGTGGVRVSGALARTVFGLKYAERNFLFSNVIGDNSRILFNRDPIQRVSAVAPWLTTDSSVYPAVVDRRLVWIVDGYTTLDSYPYSQKMSLSDATFDSQVSRAGSVQPDRQVSYIRNSVKATVDAYDGTVTLYQQDENDPVLKAWMKVFPGTVKPKSDISPDLANHLRYPEDLFKVQRNLLTNYHVSDPVTFFNNTDFWQVPDDPNKDTSQPQPPYYIVSKNLDTDTDSPSFQLTSALNRFRRDNVLAAYVSASSDPADYGKITVLTVPGEATSPKRAHNAIKTNPDLSVELGRIEGQNTLGWGNLLTLPIGDGGLLYVEPIYASPRGAGTSTYPRLIRVALAYDDRTSNDIKVGYAPTVQAALSNVLGGDAAVAATKPKGEGQPAQRNPQPPPAAGLTPPPPPDGAPTTLSPAKAAALQDLQQAIGEAHEAQKSGDFARYGQALQKLDDAMTKFTQTK